MEHLQIKKIDKATANVYLIDIFLSPFITTDHYFPVGQNEKLKLIEKVIKEFDVTLVNDSFEHFKENLTNHFNQKEGIGEMFKGSMTFRRSRFAAAVSPRPIRRVRFVAAVSPPAVSPLGQFAAAVPLLILF
jgi:hypothetical protein